ncbi:MAG TPA: TonB-dependent receptor [Pyrinomonadaceae bacterium]|jgi:outer membrane receptor protein involved in Fe transport|nr:TonB-dependent receptor [Pyrinomonadaceae bacterium]
MMNYRAHIYTLALLLFLTLLVSVSAGAQTRIGTIQGTVKDPNGALVSGASVTLTQGVTGYQQTTQTDAQGVFKLVNIPFNSYTVRVTAEGFQATEHHIDMESAIPLNLDLSLAVGEANVTVTVEADADHAEHDKISSDTDITQSIIERQAGAAPSRGIEAIVASAPGLAPDDNGRLHPRGSESQVQYVVDGIPVTENLSAIFSTSLDARTLRTVEVMTGGIPAEFGDKLGAVVNVNTRSGLETPTQGGLTFSGGSFSTGEVGADFSTRTGKFGFLTNLTASTSQRFLDPATIDNFHNFGRTGKGFFRLDYQFDQNNSLRGTFLFGGSNFQVPNRVEQEAAGQDQRQRLRNSSQFITYEHIFSPNALGQFSFFNRYGTARLTSNPESTPVAAFQDRTLQNTGGIAAISLTHGTHNIKFGGQLTWTPVREHFSFYTTDPFDDLVDENGMTHPNPVNNFTAANPFNFDGRRTGHMISLYVQDQFTPFPNFTVSAGIRYDHYKLVISESGVSPRLAIGYYIPRTQTTLRASYNRFFQPPPAENLLLASSSEAAVLSPLAVLQGQAGVRPILPDKQNAFEVGVQQQLSRFLRLNVMAYQKRITNFGDKDQFFDTGIIFPISISSGRVTGTEIRLESTDMGGFRGFVSYANARAYGVTPINGGLFLGEAVESLDKPGLIFANDHDQRNSLQFQMSYTHAPSGIYAIFGGRYDSGYPTDVEPGTTLADFTAQGFDPRLYNEIDFQRGRVRPRTILNFSIGADLLQKERASLNLQFDIQNLTDELFLYNFESVFSGTHIGSPRLLSGRLALRFK